MGSIPLDPYGDGYVRKARVEILADGLETHTTATLESGSGPWNVYRHGLHVQAYVGLLADRCPPFTLASKRLRRATPSSASGTEATAVMRTSIPRQAVGPRSPTGPVKDVAEGQAPRLVHSCLSDQSHQSAGWHFRSWPSSGCA